MKKYSREKLIELCENSIVKESNWNDRDTKNVHFNIAKAWVLLKAGFKFKVLELLEDTIRVEIFSKGWNYFEYIDNTFDENMFYLPTQEALDKADGKDWY